MTEPLVRNCENCEHFDGDVFCSLPTPEKLIHGHIPEPELVVCAKHQVREADHQMANWKAEEADNRDDWRLP